MTNNSHRDCRHEATKAARTACRKLRAQGIDTTTGIDSVVAHRLHRAHPEHNLYCCWHATMSYVENWDDSRAEGCDWAQAEPTADVVFTGTEDLLGGLCRCHEAYDNFSC